MKFNANRLLKKSCYGRVCKETVSEKETINKEEENLW